MVHSGTNNVFTILRFQIWHGYISDKTVLRKGHNQNNDYTQVVKVLLH